jgi:hypothetical protein
MPTIPNGYFTDIYKLRLGSNNLWPSYTNIGSSKIKNLYIGSNRVYHPEALDWVNRSQNNGGAVISFATLDAVSDFCYAIDAAGLRDRFSRLNLFAGETWAGGPIDYLASVLTPLYRGFSFSGTQLGNTTDTNFNFVDNGTDYVPNVGLIGDGSNKALLTGLSSEASAGGVSTFYDSHLAVYAVTDNSGGNIQYALGSTDSNNYIGTYLNFNDYAANTPLPISDVPLPH